MQKTKKKLYMKNNINERNEMEKKNFGLISFRS